MTINDHENEPEPLIVTQAIETAEQVAKKVASYLVHVGCWDYALVSVARRLDVAPGHAFAPGATALELDRPRMAPALGNEADALRKIADQLDEMERAEGVTISEYVHDKSDYASGRKEWPR